MWFVTSPRAENENILVPDPLNCRAFPHAAEVLEAGDIQLSGKFPSLRKRFGPVDQHAAFFILRLSAVADIIISGLLIKKDLRISLMLRVIRMRSEERLGLLLARIIIEKRIHAGVWYPRPVRISVITGIEKLQLISFRPGRSGICTLIVEIAVRFDRHADIFPCNEIAAYGLIPVFESVDSSPRAPLIE